jgi:hypothetical protein
MKHRLHDFSARLAKWRGGQNPLASAPCRCNTPRVANHGDAPIQTGSKAFFIAPSVPFSFEAGLTRKGQLCKNERIQTKLLRVLRCETAGEMEGLPDVPAKNPSP